MKRFSDEHVEAVAREFVSSRKAILWSAIGPELREALLDAHVIEQLRVAYIADSVESFTAEQIIGFREALAYRLADPKGIAPTGRRHRFSPFKVHE